MKKNVRASKVLPDLFEEESLFNFLLEVERVNASLIHRDPTEDGWSFTGELRGTGKNAPELFRIYEKAGSKMVLLSDFVNRSVFNSSGATNPSQHETGTARAMQATRSSNWTSMIAEIYLLKNTSSTSLAHQRLHALLIARAVFEVIGSDLARLLESSDASDMQALIAKEAGAAYESGLKNFLTSIGSRKKKGTPRQLTTEGSIPWEWLTVFRAQQFVLEYGVLPGQDWLIKQLRQDGVTYSEGNGRGPSKWRDLFARVGLGSLPESLDSVDKT